MSRPVVITRPLAQAMVLAQRVRLLGRDAVVLPLLEISPLPDQRTLRAALADLARYRMVAFVSPNAIDAAFAHIDQWPRTVTLAVLGEGSRAALAAHGVRPDQFDIVSPLDPEHSDSESLLKALDLTALAGQSVLIVRGESGRELMGDALRSAGVIVSQVAAYRRCAPGASVALEQQLRALLEQDCDWLITSSEGLRALVELARQFDQSTPGVVPLVVKMQHQHWIVPHARIAHTANTLGLTRLTLTGSGDERLLAALQSHTMNEMPPIAEPSASSAPTVPAASSPMPEARAPSSATEQTVEFIQRPITVAVIVLGVLLAAHAWHSHNRILGLQEEMARSLKRGEVSNADSAAQVRTVLEANTVMQIKVGVLESRQSEAQSQHFALEQLYQDLSKNRDEWALSEIEQVLSTASQQLQLSANVQGALIALQNADRALARTDKPQFITIRRAIAKDIETLRGLPTLDLIGVALRLDGVIAEIDKLPLLSDERPTVPMAPVASPRSTRLKAGVKPGAVSMFESVPWNQALRDVWQSWSSEMWADVRQLIRVRSVETPEALMLAPDQAYFLRENLKLRLLNARLALLSRNETAFRTDLVTAQETLLKYFDTRAKATQSAQSLLRLVQANNLAIDMPSLAESLNAVRNYKAKP